jgi:hypothetical protein
MFIEITKISELQPSERQKGHYYRQVYFKTKEGKTLWTYLDPYDRNWHRWRKWLKIGNRLVGDFKMINKSVVDADSYFFPITASKVKEMEKSKPPETLEQAAKLGIFG